MKAQWIRLADVWIIGPTLILASYRLPQEHQVLKKSLLVFGIGTIGYNWRNWSRVRRQLVHPSTSDGQR